MKRIIILLATAIVALGFVSYAEEYSEMSVDELIAIENAIQHELAKRGEISKLNQGRYLVGRDISSGMYTLNTYKLDDKRTCWGIAVEFEYGLIEKYKTDLDAFYRGVTSEKPNSSEYYTNWELFDNDTLTITIEDGTWLIVENMKTDDSFLTIEKRNPLFMDD